MNKTLFAALLIFALAAWPDSEALASCTTSEVNAGVNSQGNSISWTNDCTDDDDVLIETGSVLNWDACYLMSVTGAVDVVVTLDGTNWSTAPLNMIDNGAVTTVPVIVTVAGRVYSFVSKFAKIRVIQNGATDADATLRCWRYQ